VGWAALASASGGFDIGRPPFGRGAAAAWAGFAPGDTLLLYTDGTTEARDNAGRFFDLPAFLAGRAVDGPAEVTAQVLSGLAAHVGGHLDDDVALLVVRRKADGATPVSQS